VRGTDFDGLAFFRAIHESGARALLIGRRALVPTTDGVSVHFADIWQRRQAVTLAQDTEVQLPALDDLILTKRFGSRPKDVEDIRLLTILKSESKP